MKGLDDSEDSLNVYENISINSDMNFDSEQWKEIEQNEIKAKTTPKIRITEQFIILKRICDWSSAPQQPSFYTFCTRKEQELVDRFLQDNPSVKDWVYLNPHEYRIKGGIWLNDRRTN